MHCLAMHGDVVRALQCRDVLLAALHSACLPFCRSGARGRTHCLASLPALPMRRTVLMWGRLENQEACPGLSGACFRPGSALRTGGCVVAAAWSAKP